LRAGAGAHQISFLPRIFYQPKRRTARCGLVFIRWGWDGNGDYLDAIDILVDRGSGYTHLVTDTTPNYIDGTPPPATAEKRTYKAIFKVGDARVGQWSDEVSITVGG
jgi:hypothetical protein